MNLIAKLTKSQIKENLPNFKPGDKVKVSQKIKEGGKERVAHFEGIIIAIKNAGVGRTITIRKVAAGGIGVEKTFPVHSPTITKISILKRGKVRRAKLYYLRNLTGKAARLKEKHLSPEELVVWEAVAPEESSEESGEERVENSGEVEKQEVKSKEEKEKSVEVGNESEQEEREESGTESEEEIAEETNKSKAETEEAGATSQKPTKPKLEDKKKQD